MESTIAAGMTVAKGSVDSSNRPAVKKFFLKTVAVKLFCYKCMLVGCIITNLFILKKLWLEDRILILKYFYMNLQFSTVVQSIFPKIPTSSKVLWLQHH